MKKSYYFTSLLIWMIVNITPASSAPLEINVDKLQCDRQRAWLSCQTKDDSIKQVSAKRNKAGQCFYVDRKGKPYNTQKYDVCYNQFREGAAFVCIKKNGDKKCGLAKLNGDYLVPPIYDDIRIPKDGMIAFEKAGEWGFMDINKKVISTPQYSLVRDFSEGLAQIKIKGKGYKTTTSFIDKAGEVVFTVPKGVKVVGSFQEDLILFRDGKKWGYMDKKGAVAIPPQYSLAKGFSQGYASVRLTETTSGIFQWGLINKENQLVHLYTGEIAGVDNFHNGAVQLSFACDKQKNKYNGWDCSYGCLDLKGKLTSTTCGTMTTNQLPFR